MIERRDWVQDYREKLSNFKFFEFHEIKKEALGNCKSVVPKSKSDVYIAITRHYFAELG